MQRTRTCMKDVADEEYASASAVAAGGWFLHVPSFLLGEGLTAIVDVRPKMICNSVQLREVVWRSWRHIHWKTIQGNSSITSLCHWT